jgi:isocitrate/isopropylmalate dehydrogenase
MLKVSLMTDHKTYSIAVLPGDGIGPDVIAESLKALAAVESRLRGVHFEMQQYSVGAGEYLRSGDPLPPATLEKIKQHDAILLGAMGLPNIRWPEGVEMTPQIDIREKLDLYCGLRPIRLYHELHTPLKKYKAGEIDFLIVRESTEGLFSTRLLKHSPDASEVTDTMRITRGLRASVLFCLPAGGWPASALDLSRQGQCASFDGVLSQGFRRSGSAISIGANRQDLRRCG